MPRFAIAGLSAVLLVSQASAEPEFLRGVNLAGPAVAIDGRRWDGDDAKDFACRDKVLVLKQRLTLRPEADAGRTTMLHSFRWSNDTCLVFTKVPDGVYTVWLHVVEDNNSETFDIMVEGMPAVRRFVSGPEGTWKRVGPMVAEVTDGDLELKTSGGAANICGVELWNGAPAGVKPLRARKAPKSPSIGKFAGQKPRIVVMTDIGGDPDDRQSLARYLLYACDFETEGFCTGFGWGHDKVTRPDLIHKAIDAYGEVVPNLLKHRKDYPSAESLHALVKDGSNSNPHTVGPEQDSEASEWIIRVLERDDLRPVWFTIWGGPRELAQALWKMERTKTPDELARLKAKIRVHSIADQDRTAGWIKENHPEVFYLFSEKLYRGVWAEGDQEIVSPAWVKEHLQGGHGPLGDPDIYPPNAAGKKGVKEGDTPSYFGVLRNGLSDPEAPEWGGWGGRFRYRGVGSEFVPERDMLDGKPNMYYTIWRWRTAYQNEFEARMDWCVEPFAKANHAPVVLCNGKKGVGTVFVDAKPGERVVISAAGSMDSDGDALNYRWWHYREAGTYNGEVKIEGASAGQGAVIVPKNAGESSIHVILEVTDDGAPPLTAYRRVVVRVK